MSGRHRILITGASGLFGANALFEGRKSHELLGLYRSHPISVEGTLCRNLDLSEIKKTTALLRELAPEVVIHAAADSNIDHCESARAQAYKSNFEVTEGLVSACGELGIKLVYFSTDAFFEKKDYLFKESDKPTPMNYYGELKAWSERLVQERLKDSIVVRTNFFGWNAQNKQSLAEWVIARCLSGEEFPMFDDVWFTPILANQLARIIFELIQIDFKGIIHVAGSQPLTKYQFGLRVAEKFKLSSQGLKKSVVSDVRLAARRSQAMALDSSRLQKLLPQVNLSLEAGLEEMKQLWVQGYVKQLKAAAGQGLDFLTELP
ncbi:MAG: SDR family oxidoreductase [Oligoflexia bacterium]|nr:SDR family oxidoreductase [Oligoflexia bacterium]